MELVLLRLLCLLCRLGDGGLLRLLGVGDWLFSHLGEGDRLFREGVWGAAPISSTPPAPVPRGRGSTSAV
uniref:DUF3778 domain-containing protein n=1 Tax=Oryza brachyantha TaxID=4533 RepID=J3N1P1_ORYBR